MMKKLTLGLILSGLSISAFAAAAPQSDNMTSPVAAPVPTADNNGGWLFGFETIYAKSANSYKYGQIATYNDDFSAINSSKSLYTSNSSNWGGTASIGYLFPHSTRDLTLSYTFLKLGATDHASADPTNDLQWIPVMDFANQKNAKNTLDQKLNAVDLTAGQYFNWGNHFNLHPFTGLRYANINLEDNTTYWFDNNNGVNWKNVNKSNYQGVGPRLGLDASANLGAGFSIVGTAAGSLLIGHQSASSTMYYVGDQFDSFVDVDHASTGGSTKVIPEIDGKLGLGYEHNFGKNALSLQAGYEAARYYNAVNYGTRDVEGGDVHSNIQDFAYHGPYAKIQFSFS